MKSTIHSHSDRSTLTQGWHDVKITEVQEGQLGYHTAPFWHVAFENPHGIAYHHFPETDEGLALLKQLFAAAGLPEPRGFNEDLEILLERSVQVHVEEHTHYEPLSGERHQRNEVTGFRAVA
ncbi:hypothetical protein SAMN05421823_102286 [Catalinimonas alkaloidigena]|uniref:Uncharacterized protein n=1 Tax=Catalinimonas alkaloidigena TaxID=1075417 RepID=A0A1G9AFY7_9BACT|nr:hypothetical protein [Catalinimonas alkaloidigena]SDK26178.1 hypothetical protein SAMN05421823_102286 [Catalinimonas alkaloidigena]